MADCQNCGANVSAGQEHSDECRDDLQLDASGPICDFKVPTMRVNDKLVICTVDYPIYLTREQAMAFFNLVPKHF